jgi:tetratricopeptide (TPR) repeat protein
MDWRVECRLCRSRRIRVVDVGRRSPGHGIAAGLSTALAVGAGAFTNAATSAWTWSTGVGLVVFAGGWVGLEVWRAARADDNRSAQVAEVLQGMRVRRGSLDPPTGSAPLQVRGRADLIAALSTKYRVPDGCFHVLTGLGGIGKTTVALALAQQAAAEDLQVWWMTVRDRQTLANDLLDLLVDLGATHQEVQQALSGVRSVVDLMWRYLERSSKPWLLVIDNADQPDVLAAEGTRVADGNGVVRSSRRGLVVVTSRVTSAEVWGTRAVVHRVDALSTGDAASVVADLAPNAGTDRDAAALAVRLGGLPLALRAAGRYLSSPQAYLDGVSSFSAYQTALDKQSTAGATKPLAALEEAWDASLDLLGRQGLPHARTILRLLGGFASAPVPAWVIDDPALYRSQLFNPTVMSNSISRWRARVALPKRGHRYDPATHRKTIAGLCQLGLLDIDVAGPGQVTSLVAHPLVFEVNAAWLSEHLDTNRSVRTTVIALLTAAARDRDTHDAAQYQLWPLLVAHLFHALTMASNVGRADQLALLAAATTTSWGLTRAGHHLSALSLATATAEASCRLLSADHPRHLEARHHIAAALSELGRFQDAAAEFSTVVSERTRLLGAEHADTLSSRMNQADLMMRQGRYDEAEAEFRAVYHIQRRVLGDTSRETLLTGSNIGQVLNRRGCYERAESQLRTILALQRSSLGEQHSNTFGAWQSLADALAGQGYHAEAEAEYRASLAVARQVLGREHPWTLEAQQGLAEVLVHRQAGELAEAELRAVLTARKRVLGNAHPDTLTSRYWLAELLARRGQWDHAVSELRAVLSDQQQALESHHPDLRRTQESIDRWLSALDSD